MIKAIIFDWFGVCTKENWADCLARELKQRLNIDEKIIRSEFKKLIQPFARTKLTPEDFLKTFLNSLDKTKNPDDFYYLFKTIPKINYELLDFILSLKSHYQIYLLSNNFGSIFPNYEKEIDFRKYFDKLFLSHKLKLSKTQNKIWEKVLSKIDFKPTELAFVDNKKKYLEYPKTLGINTILFLNNEQIKDRISLLDKD
ncbi:HAD hydrolase-like protein [Patescibacteria group bacterium]|nr:HAD hydrolase-like protein [Patescibacteria group bacterium]